MQITILSDADSWLNTFLPELIVAFEKGGHSVAWLHEVQDIRKGDLLFFLGCSQLASPETLQRNRHNLVVHESALPEGKGWSPLTWQVLEGKNEIPISLFEAGEKVDSGRVYLRDVMHFTGTELVQELRLVQARTSMRLCLDFVRGFPEIINRGEEQQGASSYYRRRTPEDSRLDLDKTVRDQFNLLRVADNDRYPVFFEIGGVRYYLKVAKAQQ